MGSQMDYRGMLSSKRVGRNGCRSGKGSRSEEDERGGKEGVRRGVEEEQERSGERTGEGNRGVCERVREWRMEGGEREAGEREERKEERKKRKEQRKKREEEKRKDKEEER
jgi:hypothetical protein